MRRGTPETLYDETQRSCSVKKTHEFFQLKDLINSCLINFLVAMAPSRRPRGPSILKSAKTKPSLKKQSPGTSVLKSQLPKTSKVAAATPKVSEKSSGDLTPAVTSPRKPRTRRSLPSPQVSLLSFRLSKIFPTEGKR